MTGVGPREAVLWAVVLGMMLLQAVLDGVAVFGL